MRLLLAASSAFFVACANAGRSSTHVLHERRDYLARPWTKLSRAHGADVVTAHVGLTQSNIDKGHDLLMEVSDPQSPKYGKHYTEDEINKLFAPTVQTVDAVGDWLESAGISKDRIFHSFNYQWLKFDASVSELESLLKTKYYMFEHRNGDKHAACDEYYVPNHIQRHVDFITPGTLLDPSTSKNKLAKRNLNNPHENQKGSTGQSHARHGPAHVETAELPLQGTHASAKDGNLKLCSAVISPDCIKAMYKIPKAYNASGKYELGIFESLGDHYSQGNLNRFFKSIYPEIPVGTHPKCNAVDGAFCATTPQESGLESDLDFQMAYPLIYPSELALFQTDDEYYETSDNRGFLNDFFYAIDKSYCRYRKLNRKIDPKYPNPRKGGYEGKTQCGKYKPTNVISISYGGVEADLPVGYQKRLCHEIMKLGMRGVSVVVASGDDGVASGIDSISPNGCLPMSQKKNGTIFTPSYPVGCPYITTVGATHLPPGRDARADMESAAAQFASGGGFSNIFAPLDFQKEAQRRYLTKYAPKYKSYRINNDNGSKRKEGKGRYNAAGRGFPDVSAVGQNILIYATYTNGRQPLTVGGTSASTPLFASILARINQERAAVNKSPVGFVNPILYANPDMFRDITVGSNPGCGSDGFKAQPGWDPLTGLGTPDYQKMLDVFMALP